MRTRIITAFFIICLGVHAFTARNDSVNQIDVSRLISRVVNKNGIGLDSIYNEYISRSSPYYGDFYGLQVIQNVSREEIRKDFKVVSETDSTISVKTGNETITVFDRQHPMIIGIKIPYPYIIYNGNTYKEFIQQKEVFYQWLAENHLSDKYLIKNDFYKEELCVENCWKKSTLEVIKDTVLEKEDNCIHIFMDRVHGDTIAFKNLLAFIQENSFDWMGIEMMDRQMQKIVDEYIFSDENSTAYQFSKNKLFEYYSSGWIRHFKREYSSFEENPFCQLMELLRQKRIKVYAMEESNEMFLLFRNGETPFGGAVRSALWANSLPTKGRGIIFGGSAHFTSPRAVNFQDFYKMRAPKQKIIIADYTHRQ